MGYLFSGLCGFFAAVFAISPDPETKFGALILCVLSALAGIACAINGLGKVSDGRIKPLRERIEDLEKKQADALQAIKAFMERRKPEGREAAQVLLDEGCFTDPVVVRALRACADLEGEG
jgi:hypothetical protein